MTPVDDEATLFRGDLVRRYWRVYALVAAVALIVHVAWIAKFGISRSTDFGVRYDPAARELLASLGVKGVARAARTTSVGAVGWARIGYIGFTAACYALFGTSLKAVVYPQVALAWLVYPLVFHILLHITGRLRLALGATAVWMTFLDTYQWQFWAVPDALYRLIFLTMFFVLLRLWETRRQVWFAIVLPFAIVVATVFRIETSLYALPALWLAVRPVRRTHPIALTAATLAGLTVMGVVARRFVADAVATFIDLQAKGYVLPGSGIDVPGLTSIAAPPGLTTYGWIAFFGRLFVRRMWYAMTPLPALWSSAHRYYYAAYVVPAYILAAVGLVAALRRSDFLFLFCFWLFAAGILLQGLVAVDPSMRYAYTPQVFLFFCATLGCQWISRSFPSRVRSTAIPA